jgi:YD repeat-containing protein
MVRSRELVEPLTDGAFGEEVSLFDGATRFGITDISIPGNNELLVSMRRSWDPQNQGLSQQVIGDWVIDVPNMSALVVGSTGWPEQRCTQATFPPTIQYGTSPNYLVLLTSQYFQGYHVAVSGAHDSMLLVQTTDPKLKVPAATLGAVSPWTTKDGWHFACLPSVQRGSGEGFIGVSPDGKRYTFDWMTDDTQRPLIRRGYQSGFYFIVARSMVRIYATKVEDRFGNWVRYQWLDDRLSRIYSNDGREISLTYDASRRLSTVTANGKVWTYKYLPYAISQVDQYYLSEVDLPDSSKWSYDTSHFVRRILYKKGTLDDFRDGDGYLLQSDGYCNVDRLVQGGGGAYAITAPSGATAAYTFTPMRHGHKNVFERCIDGPDYSKGRYNLTPLQHDVLSLTSKTVSGLGVSALNTSYSYSGLDWGYEMTSDPTWNTYINATPTPNLKTVTVTEPDGTTQIYIYGRDSNLNEGQLFRQETRKDGVLYRTVVHDYVTDSEVSGYPFPATVGGSSGPYDNRLMSSDNRPEKSRVTTQDGVNFRWAVNTFDAFARPSTITRSSSAVPIPPPPPPPPPPPCESLCP